MMQQQPSTTKTKTKTTYQIVLIGDSDIAYWPSELFPTNIINNIRNDEDVEEEGTTITTKTKTTTEEKRSNNVSEVVVSKSGHSGSTLEKILPHLRHEICCLQQQQQQKQKLYDDDNDDATKKGQQKQLQQDNNNNNNNIFVACAGENDIGNGINLNDSINALERFIDIIFENSNNDNKEENQQQPRRYLIFFGPKFEPWLNDDKSSKKQYTKMSRAFKRCCERYHNIYYIDCITMFCTQETRKQPGSILGGLAMADCQYFSNDQLHLNHHGYKIWKDCIENCIRDNIIVL